MENNSYTPELNTMTANCMIMEGSSDEEIRAKFVQVLAKAASDREYYEKLKSDTDNTLRKEGIEDGGFFIQILDKEILSKILNMYDQLGGVICKKR